MEHRRPRSHSPTRPASLILLIDNGPGSWALRSETSEVHMSTSQNRHVHTGQTYRHTLSCSEDPHTLTQHKAIAPWDGQHLASEIPLSCLLHTHTRCSDTCILTVRVSAYDCHLSPARRHLPPSSGAWSSALWTLSAGSE